MATSTTFKKLLASAVTGTLICITFLDAVICSSSTFPGGPDTTLIYRICNGGSADATFAHGVGDVIWQLLLQTPNKGYNFYYSSNDESSDVVFGHAACNGVISALSCSACLNIARDELGPCHHPERIGAQVQLQDCRIRYENYPFVE